MAISGAYRLALDLGSTSLGWAMFRLGEDGSPTAIIRSGVRIFSDGRNPKDGSSLAVTRRAARAMRRRRDRLLKRKSRMLGQLVRHGFFPADEAARKALERLNPYQLRAKGLREALTPRRVCTGPVSHQPAPGLSKQPQDRPQGQRQRRAQTSHPPVARTHGGQRLPHGGRVVLASAHAAEARRGCRAGRAGALP